MPAVLSEMTIKWRLHKQNVAFIPAGFVFIKCVAVKHLWKLATNNGLLVSMQTSNSAASVLPHQWALAEVLCPSLSLSA